MYTFATFNSNYFLGKADSLTLSSSDFLKTKNIFINLFTNLSMKSIKKKGLH